MFVGSSRRLRRQQAWIDRSLKRATRAFGQSVLWYEFDPTSVEDVDSADQGVGFDDDVYDEGGTQFGGGQSRKWQKPKRVQVFQAMLEEGMEQDTGDGTYTVDGLTLIASYALLVQQGISNPTDRGAHIRDRIEFDGRLFKVSHFEPRGRISDYIETVTVTAVEVKDDERVTDAVPWHA
jgi:hypothetical protein